MNNAVPEAGRFVREYLYKLRWAKSESTKLYMQRHRMLLGKLEGHENGGAEQGQLLANPEAEIRT